MSDAATGRRLKGAPSLRYRRASEADLAAEYDVFVAAQKELHARRGAPWPAPPFDPSGRWAQVHRHLLAHDGERSFVAECDGSIVGFTAAIVRGDCWFFSALFVDPAHQARGVGRRLLDLAWEGQHRRRITIHGGDPARFHGHLLPAWTASGNAPARARRPP